MRVAAFVLVLTACGASARQTEIRSAYLTLDTAESAFHVYDVKHQQDLANAQPDQGSAQAAVSAWLVKRNAIDRDITIGVRAVATAAALDDDPSLAGMLKAVKIVTDELAALGVKLP